MEPTFDTPEALNTPSKVGDSNSKIVFKLEDLLPRYIMQSVLNNDTEVSKHISPYLEALTLAHEDPALSEIDLNLPSSYALIFTKQYSSSVLVKIMERVIDVFPISEVLYFPYMQLDNLQTLVERLQNKLTQKKAHYKEIHLYFVSDSATSISPAAEICKVLLCCKPSSFLLNIDDFSSGFVKVKKAIDTVMESVPAINRPEIKNSSSKSKKPKELKQKAGKKVTKKLPPLLKYQSQMFTYDFQLMSPYIKGTQMFTAYSYWNMEDIHKCFKFTGKNVNVAILDTGVDINHKAFKGKNLENKIFCYNRINTDTDGHGTLCAGILCGKAFKCRSSDGEEMECPDGIAPDANLRVYKVFENSCSAVPNMAVVNALQHIETTDPPIDVISISFGSLAINLKVIEAINDLVKKGVIVVCAASNYGHQYSQTVCYPARMGNVLCIGSHDSHGKASSFSPVGQQIDFLAPGEGISGPNSTLYFSSICTDSGTSYATPAVAGLVCLIIEFIKANVNSEEEMKRYKNHWVMKEILRKISTCPGRHTYDEGFGALNPINFFRRPHELIQSVIDEVQI